jgi:antitoxin CcdA
MVEREILMEKREHVVSKTCDRCMLTATRETPFEFQEFVHIHFTGGYGSVFGDESFVEGDFCQHCVKELLGDYLRIED